MTLLTIWLKKSLQFQGILIIRKQAEYIPYSRLSSLILCGKPCMSMDLAVTTIWTIMDMDMDINMKIIVR